MIPALNADERSSIKVSQEPCVRAALGSPSLVPAIVAFDGIESHLNHVPLLVDEGSSHLRRRKSLHPAFGRPAVDQYVAPHAESIARVLAGELTPSPSFRTVFSEPMAVGVAARVLDLDPALIRDLHSTVAKLSDTALRPSRRTLELVKAVRTVKAEALSGSSPFLDHLGDASPDDQTMAVFTMTTVGLELVIRSINAAIVALSKSPIPVVDDAFLDTAIAGSGITPSVNRRALEDVIINDVSVDKDCALAIAIDGRDGSPFPFGLGRHYCLGAPYAHSVVSAASNALQAFDLEFSQVARRPVLSIGGFDDAKLLRVGRRGSPRVIAPMSPSSG